MTTRVGGVLLYLNRYRGILDVLLQQSSAAVAQPPQNRLDTNLGRPVCMFMCIISNESYDIWQAHES